MKLPAQKKMSKSVKPAKKLIKSKDKPKKDTKKSKLISKNVKPIVIKKMNVMEFYVQSQDVSPKKIQQKKQVVSKQTKQKKPKTRLISKSTPIIVSSQSDVISLYSIKDDKSEPISKKKIANNQKVKQLKQTQLLETNHILVSQEHSKISELEFELFHMNLERKKMISCILVDGCGQIVYADRLGSEHFEGSLNNFTKNAIQTIVVDNQREKFLQELSRVSLKNKKAIKFVIYSKNSKRRYSKSSSEISYNNKDIFNRFLKSLTTRITPIQIQFHDFGKFEGFWNQKLVQNNTQMKLFLLETRLSTQIENIEEQKLKQDKMIKKFIKYTDNKKRGYKLSSSQLNISEQEDQIDEENYATPIKHKSLQMRQQIADHQRQDKTSLTRGGLFNSNRKDSKDQ